MYTDGSKTKQGAGSGYVILSGKDRVLSTPSINLMGEASIFQAELIAIQEAAKQLFTQEDTQGLYIKFFSDLQAALQALKSNNCKAQTVKDTHDALNTLADQAKLVRLTWIEAHIGLDGNELADEYAKLGTVDDSTKIRTLVGLVATLVCGLRAVFFSLGLVVFRLVIVTISSSLSVGQLESEPTLLD